MKIKLDENLPLSLVEELTTRGHDVDAIWQAAQKEGRFLITQDLDFSDARRFQPGSHAGVLIVRLAHPGRFALALRLGALFSTEDVERWSKCLVVATEHKVRIKRPH